MLDRFSPVQQLYIQRLARFLRMEQFYDGQFTRDDWHWRLINYAIVSAFDSCNSEGLGPAARQVMVRAREK